MNRQSALLLFSMIGIVPSLAFSQRATIYDNFSSGYLDPTKWVGAPICTLPSTFDCARTIRGGQLILQAVTYGLASSDTGSLYDTSYINIANPTSVKSVDVRVVVPSTRTAGCSSNVSPSHSAFTVTGSFFNTGSGNWTDDVQAYVIIDRTASSSRGLMASAFLSTGYINFFGNVSLGSVAEGERVRVTLRWDAAGSQFIVSLTHPGQAPIIVALPYTQANSMPPAIPQVLLGIRNFVPNCVASQSVAGMTAAVSRVMVNSPTTP